MTHTPLLPPTAVLYKQVYRIDVTPEMARSWLSRGCFNREINYETVARYVRQIKAGLWRLTHQGIALTKEGVVLDGQHRLLAVIKTGETVPMLVFPDQPEDMFSYIDCGRNRSHLDMLRLGQNDNTLSSMHAQTLKAFLAGPHCHTTNRWSSAELNLEYQKHREPIHFIVNLFRGEKDKRVNDSTVRGLIARAALHVENEVIADFTAKLLGDEGASDHRLSGFVKCLRLWDDRRHNTRREIYKRGQQTLLAWLQDRPDPWSINVSSDPFPLPKN